MYKTLCKKVPKDSDMPERAWTMECRERVRDGKLYDGLNFAFYTEKSPSGEYIPLRDRRPSVRYNMVRKVIEESVSILFSEGHFPVVRASDKEVQEKLKKLLKDRKVNEVMIEAAMTGSVGSSAILMCVIKNRVFFRVMSTKYLTPEFSTENPEKLVGVVEQYKVKAEALKAAGIKLPNDQDTEFMWRCEWTPTQEVHYVPQTLADFRSKKAPKIDTSRTVTHALGFVPMVWCRNLPGGDGIDGACTFPEEVVDTQIELEYLLSQGGRGLKYTMDPTLLIKEPAIGTEGEMVKGAGNALVVSQDGDAKLLEINGQGTEAVLKFVKQLREAALESLNGRSADPAKLSAARSAKAMELLNQPLIWLADKLRISYGEGAFLQLVRMVCKASHKFELVFGEDEDQETIYKLSSKSLSLHWPAWYAPTHDERQVKANTLKTLCDASIMSQESAIETSAPDYDIEDLPGEKVKIASDQQRKIELAAQGVEVQERIAA